MSSTDLIFCDSDQECRDNELCFVNTTFFKEKSAEQLLLENETLNGLTLIGCECNTWYQWDGINCDELTGETRFFVAIGFIVCISAIVNLTLLCTSCCSYIHSRPERGICNIDAHMSTTILLLISSFGLFLWTLSMGVSGLKTSGRFLAEEIYQERDPYKGRQNIYGFLGGFMSAVFTTLASLNVCLLWIEIADKLRNQNGRYFLQSQIKKSKRFLSVYAVLGFLSLVAAGLYERGRGNDNPTIIGFVVVPFALVLVGLNFYGARVFTKVVKQTAKNAATTSKRFVDSNEEGGAVARTSKIEEVSLNDSANHERAQVTSELQSEVLTPPPSEEVLTTPGMFAPKQSSTDNDSLTHSRFNQVQRNLSRSGSKLTSKAFTSFKSVRSNLFRLDKEVVDPGVRRVLVCVRNTAVATSIAILVFTISSLVFAIQDVRFNVKNGGQGWKELIAPGVSFAGLKFAYYIQAVSISCIHGALTYYVFIAAISGRRKKKKRKN